jgi:hypothetical protein
VLQVGILGSTRENFVADDNQATGNGFGHMASTTSTNGNDRALGATWLFLPESNRLRCPMSSQAPDPLVLWLRHRRRDHEPFSG